MREEIKIACLICLVSLPNVRGQIRPVLLYPILYPSNRPEPLKGDRLSGYTCRFYLAFVASSRRRGPGKRTLFEVNNTDISAKSGPKTAPGILANG